MPAAPAPAPRAARPADGTSLATSILGWGGALALVLAASYLVRLAIDAGWLTPMRQVALAGMAGLGLIGAGFWLRRADRRTDARHQLRVAYQLFSGLGAEAFAERARRELAAAGVVVRPRHLDTQSA